jgi:hypothetical protein
MTNGRKLAQSGINVMILKIFSPRYFAKILAFLTQNKGKLCKSLIITLVFEKTPIFRQKLGKIAQNCDHNIDPWSPCSIISLCNGSWPPRLVRFH